MNLNLFESRSRKEVFDYLVLVCRFKPQAADNFIAEKMDYLNDPAYVRKEQTA